MLIASITAGGTMATLQAMASRSIRSRIRSRLEADKALESQSHLSLNPRGKITAAAQTGPARQPRPASSAPASIPSPSRHRRVAQAQRATI